MKKTLRMFTTAVAVVAITGGTIALLRTEAAPPARTTKTVEMSCKNGWRGSGGGSYGGVSFGIDCNFDSNAIVIEGVEGTEYGIRMGAESFSSGAVDCFFSGDSARVSEACGEVKVTIR